MAIAVLLLAFAPAVPSHAQSWERGADQSKALDVLFARLSAAPDSEAARAITDDIWQIWVQPDDPVLAARMSEVLAVGGLAGPANQLPLVDALIEDYPDYPEGWNMRATVYFLLGAYDNSLADIVETLEREPRHFGALAGRALIYHSQGKRDEALGAMREALEIHPFLAERTLFPELGPPPIRS